jgi:hypothetical protein
MSRTKKSPNGNGTSANLGFEATQWAAAEYKHAVPTSSQEVALRV